LNLSFACQQQGGRLVISGAFLTKMRFKWIKKMAQNRADMVEKFKKTPLARKNYGQTLDNIAKDWGSGLWIGGGG
jgi:hypothetical protein